MDGNAEIERIERERTDLLEEAARIVQAAEMTDRAVSAEEDARVLALVACVRRLEKQAEHLKRRHRQDGSAAEQEKKTMSRTRYLAELDLVRQNLLGMGETTLTLLDEAVGAVLEPNLDRSSKASELEAQTDHQHRLIHDQCLNLITLQAPVARDARFITGALDAIVDLELIGDYSYEIVTLASGMWRRPPYQVLAQLSEVAKKVREVLAKTIDAWRSVDSVQGLSVRSQEPPIRAECGAMYEKLTQLTSRAGEATTYLDLLLISRHLERILRHAVCVADRAAGAAPLEQVLRG
jgi:phosphate transport system protein